MIKKNYDYILFDLDGTLTDPIVGTINGLSFVLSKFDITIKDKTIFHQFIGPPLKDSFQTILHMTEEESETAVQYYREYYQEKGILENSPYDGIDQVLSTLKKCGKTLIVASNKPTEYVNDILKRFQLDHYFSFIAGGSMDNTRTTKEKVIQYALAQCNIKDYDRVIMVGDRKFDIVGAKTCGLDSIGVLYGYGTEDELRNAGADFIVTNVSDLPKLLLSEK